MPLLASTINGVVVGSGNGAVGVVGSGVVGAEKP